MRENRRYATFARRSVGNYFFKYLYQELFLFCFDYLGPLYDKYEGSWYLQNYVKTSTIFFTNNAQNSN